MCHKQHYITDFVLYITHLAKSGSKTQTKAEVMKQTICPHCGEKENFHFNYDYAQKHMPIINVLCNECGEFFDNNKEQQKKILIEIMEADANDGLYKTKPFNYAFLREITDQYESGEISYGKMVELLNEIAIKWHNQQIMLLKPTK